VVCVREFSGKGRGVVATVPFAPGDTIELAPVLVIPADEVPRLVGTILGRHVFAWGADGLDRALVLGTCQLCNHSYTPNAEYLHDWAGRTLRFQALGHVRPGDEITVNYNGDPASPRPVGFDVLR
jgi:hypothetical protein